MKLRPHHLLCVQSYSGKGYSEAFIRNMDALTSVLRNQKKTVINIVFAADDICVCCPKMSGGICESEAKVKIIDAKTAEHFNLTEKSYTYQDIISEIRSKMTSDIFRGICRECNWYSLNLCGSLLK